MIVIIATGCQMDSLNGFGDFNNSEGDRKELLENLASDDWNLHDSIFVEAYQLFDSKTTQTNVNKLFRYKVIKASNEGRKIIIVVPDENMVDKGIRHNAIILKLDQHYVAKSHL